jgi:conjugative relaxase-like TrwC/TraI family protein
VIAQEGTGAVKGPAPDGQSLVVEEGTQRVCNRSGAARTTCGPNLSRFETPAHSGFPAVRYRLLTIFVVGWKMLRIVQNTSAADAKSYYSAADYFTEGQELVGLWRGEAAARLGLSGEVEKDAWDALCDNQHPVTGEVLTPRQREPRRVGYDFNFHCPKSVSLIYGLTGDERIVEALRAAVGETMRDMEAEMQTRVRKGYANADRTTANMVWGEFVHTTARPVNGIPDPHLHAHCFVFNSTWDQQENRWKAGQFAGLKRDAPYFEAVFHSRLARGMEELGLPVERTRSGWELQGFAKSSLDKFSRRTALIEAKAKEKGITDPHEKDKLGATTREAKNKQLSVKELRREWQSRLTEEEADAVWEVERKLGRERLPEDDRVAKEAVGRAAEHWFERNSVIPERRLLAHALKRAVGKGSVASVEREYRRRNFVTAERDGRRLVTTRDVLAEEERMIDFARRGRGTRKPLGGGKSDSYPFTRDWLNDDQKKAVRHVLGSADRVILIRGAAGVGKTTMMREAVEAIEANGQRVFTFAPSADASRGVLRDEGFVNADTVARLLKDEKLQAEAQGHAWWIDEAGLLGTKTTAEVFELASKLDARVILSGDRRQHGSVERGSALRLLETEAGLVPAEIREIQRQKGEYKHAVRLLSEGRTEEAFGQLDRLGWIKEIPEADRYKVMAADYVAAVSAMSEDERALVVSPTHREGEKITGEIRAALKATDRLGSDEREFRILHNSNLTQAERADGLNYLPDDVLVFHQNARGHQKGEAVVVKGLDGAGLPLDQSARFQVFHPGTLRIASGDVIRVTRNGATADGKHRLNNGSLYTVKRFTADGDIVTNTGAVIPRDFGHLAYGYVVTSHAAQGKSVKQVFIGQSSESYPASSSEQFYVSVSRGKKQATVYTDDKEALLSAVSRSDDRLTATEFVAERELRERTAALQRMEWLAPPMAKPAPNDRKREERELIHDR